MSTLAKVSFQRCACSSVLLSHGGSRNPEAPITSRTFLSDSGTASNCFHREHQFTFPRREKIEANHLIPPSAVHKAILIHDNLQPEIGHRRHPLSLRKRAQELQENLAQQRRSSQSRLSHPLRIPSEHLRLEQLLQHREEDLFENDREIDVVVAEDFRSKQRSLQTSDRDLSKFTRRIEAELSVGGEKRNPRGFPSCSINPSVLPLLVVRHDSPRDVEKDEDAMRSGIAA